MTSRHRRHPFPLRYLPYGLTPRDTKRQIHLLDKSRRLYKTGQYFTRKRLASYTSKPSKHLARARKIYQTDKIAPNPKYARATGCSVAALRKIVQKGEGAYFSSGSRPNQTAQSWGIARLASSTTGGKAAAVDYKILEEGCQPRSPALRMARTARKKWGFGNTRTRHNILA